MKDYLQIRQERAHAIEPHSIKPFSKNNSATNKGDRGEQREGRNAHSSKTNSEPRKPQYSQKRRPRGAKRRKRHTQAKPIQSQENRSTATKGDRGGQRGVNTQDQSQRDHSTAKTKATE